MSTNNDLQKFFPIYCPQKSIRAPPVVPVHSLLYEMPTRTAKPRKPLCVLSSYGKNNSKVEVCLYQNQYMGTFCIEDFLGKGSFGHVVKARHSSNFGLFAIKIINSKKLSSVYENEINILQYINQRDTENSFVKYFGDFPWYSYRCVIFELLGESLYDFMKRNNFVGMEIEDVHIISRQLISAINRLYSLNVIHCDIKPENIAFVYDTIERIKVKLIDFGSSSINGSSSYRYIQSRYYRAVEVILEIGYNCLIDTWSTACVIGELLTGSPLFPGGNEIQQLGFYIQTFGNVPLKLLMKSPKISVFFIKKINKLEFRLADKFIPGSKTLFDIIYNCNSVKKYLFKTRNIPNNGLPVVALTNLLVRMLIMDPRERLFPGPAMVNHPFLSPQLFHIASPGVLSVDQCQQGQVMSGYNIPSMQHISNIYNNSILNPGDFLYSDPIINPPYVECANHQFMPPGLPNYLVNYSVPYQNPYLTSNMCVPPQNNIDGCYNNILITSHPPWNGSFQ